MAQFGTLAKNYDAFVPSVSVAVVIPHVMKLAIAQGIFSSYSQACAAMALLSRTYGTAAKGMVQVESKQGNFSQSGICTKMQGLMRTFEDELPRYKQPIEDAQRSKESAAEVQRAAKRNRTE